MNEALSKLALDIMSRANPISFVSLAQRISSAANVDEASAKACILQLHFEGEIRIDSALSVSRLDPAADLQEAPSLAHSFAA